MFIETIKLIEHQKQLKKIKTQLLQSKKMNNQIKI